MVQYKLYYFNARGRAEFIRFIFAAAGQEYEEIGFEIEQWPEYKAKSPLGQAPFLEVVENGQTFQLGQSLTIARYLARKFDLAGKSAEEQAKAEMYADQVFDLLNEMVKVHFEKDKTRKIEAVNKLFTESIPNSLKVFDNQIAKNGSGYLVASGLTWADLFLADFLDRLREKKDNLLSNAPAVKSLYEKVLDHPKVSKWIAKRPKTEKYLYQKPQNFDQ
uniref:Sigma class glutathione S-transferase 3 n=1 Tax=Brachionus plicatilis TaxID=10195 RepID=A0A2L0HIJ1_BRAPC|nr:sigma class glutathione S-transferase 3 [Brachionus plicatilis]